MYENNLKITDNYGRSFMFGASYLDNFVCLGMYKPKALYWYYTMTKHKNRVFLSSIRLYSYV